MTKRSCIFGSVALALTLVLRAPVAFGEFSGWETLPGGTFSSGPAVAAARSAGDFQDLIVYARGMDNAIWHIYGSFVDTGGWLGWLSLGGKFTSKPSATSWQGRNDTVVAKGTDDFIWIDVRDRKSSAYFQGWKQIPGGTFNTAPAIAYLSPYLHVFARKSDKVIYWARNDVSSGYNHSGWSAWTAVNPEGLLSSEPAVVSAGGQLVLVARGLDKRYWVNRGFGSSWMGWNQIPDGKFSSGPAVSSRTGADVDVFGKGMDNHIWVATVNPTDGSTPGFRQIPIGVFKSAPASSSMPSNRNIVMARALDNYIDYGTWSPP